MHFPVRIGLFEGISLLAMSTNADDFMPTRRSLLSRLKNWDDQASWQQFFDTYARLIYSVAVKTGLTASEAEDVVQETVIVVARKITGFKYDPALGSFKSWLLLITRRRIHKQLKKRIPLKVSDDTKLTAAFERVADPKALDLESAWDAEWQKNIWEIALAGVKAQFKPKQFQMFDLYVLKEWPVKEVARALGVTATHIYVIKHRISAALKKEMARLERESAA